MKSAPILLALLLAACGSQDSEAENPPATIAAAVTQRATSGEAWLPGLSEVQDAIGENCPAIREVKCQGFEEEPTEFNCTFEQAQPDGSWSERGAVIAIDGDNWINISGTGCGAPAQPDEGAASPLVEAAKTTCQAETVDADPNQVPGAFEVCIAREANAAPAEAREEICKLAVTWRGFMSEGNCQIDPE